MIKAIAVLIALLSISGMAGAFAVLDVDPKIQEIPVGTIGTYTLTLNTSDAGIGSLAWYSDNSSVLVRINGGMNGAGNFQQVGSIIFSNTPSAARTFTVEVQPQDGVTLYDPVDIKIEYRGPQGGTIKVKAVATASVIPIPELGTVVLTSAGLIGLFGLAKLRRREEMI